MTFEAYKNQVRYLGTLIRYLCQTTLDHSYSPGVRELLY